MHIVYFLLKLIGVILLLIIIIFLLFIYGFSKFLGPNTPDESVQKLKQFLGIDFQIESIIEHSSRNNHPDRPMNISVGIIDAEFDKIKNYLSTLNLGTLDSYSDDKKIKYVENWSTYNDIYCKNYRAFHINSESSEYPFFYIEMTVDLHGKVISYKEFGS